MADWLVTVYDAEDNTLTSWVIEDRTEHEAEREAEDAVLRIAGVDDWTLGKLEPILDEPLISDLDEMEWDAEMALHNGELADF